MLVMWRQADPLARLELVAILCAGPFLLFPTLAPFATLLALCALALVWLLPLILRRQPGLPVTPFNVALIPWGLVLIVSLLVSADPAQTLPKATGLILGLAVWRLLTIFALGRREVHWAAWGYLAMGTSFALIGVFGLDQSAKIPGLTQFSPAYYLPIAERFGFSIHPNELAGLICLVLPFLVSLLVGWRPTSRHRELKRTGLILLTLLIGAILLMTQSRGGWVGVAAGLAILWAAWAFVMPPSIARTVARATLLLLIVVGVLGFIWIGPERMQQAWLEPPTETAIGTFSTLNYRKELWPWALTAVNDFSFTGTGLGTFREVAFRLYPLQVSVDADIGHAHNIFLQTALDVGLPGLIVYTALLLVALGSALGVARRDEGYRPIALGLLAGLIALHVYGLADALALGSKPGLLYWYALGLIATMCLTGIQRKPIQISA